MAQEHHTIDYVEITVRDMAEAKGFYERAFGWSFNEYGPSYAGIRHGEGESGGLTVGEPQPGGPLIILYSTDIEATAKSVVEAGGRIAKETYEFPGGRRFHFADPSGNELAVWSDR